MSIENSIDRIRIDVVVSKQWNISREIAKKIIKSGAVTIGDIVVSECDARVFDGDVIKIDESQLNNSRPLELLTLKPKNIPLDIVFEDEYLLVINKQAGLTVHPGAGNYDDTLVNALIHRYGDEIRTIGIDVFRPGIVHRLDRDTTGLMIVAKTQITHSKLSEAIKNREVKRKYLALCYESPSQKSGIISANIGRDPKNREKQKVLTIGGKEAITKYNVLEVFSVSEKRRISLIEFELSTGRTHQIRVHSDHIGHSIIGDQIYGIKPPSYIESYKAQIRGFVRNLIKRQMLHAAFISFRHPITLQNIDLSADLPSDFADLLEIARLS